MNGELELCAAANSAEKSEQMPFRRTVLHCDLNNFFASVECLDRPELKGLPVAVGGSVEQRSGIILAKNDEAKKWGVKTAEVIWQAKQKCPELVILPPHYEKYVAFSHRAREIYDRYTDLVEPFGIDECWLDVSGSTGLFGSGEQIANEIRETVKKDLGITISVGVSFNKIFAKLGSDMKKPDAITVISQEGFRDKIWGLAAEEMLGVGKSTKKVLNGIGLFTIGDLAQIDPKVLRLVLGKSGEYLWSAANGLDMSPVRHALEAPPPKSVGRSTTQSVDLITSEDIERTLLSLTERVAHSLRVNRALAGTVQVHLRDTMLRVSEHQRRLSQPTRLVGVIKDIGAELVYEVWNGKPLRSIGIRACELVSEDECIQLSLEYDAHKLERLETLEGRVDELRLRFGRNAIVRGTLVGNPVSHGEHPVFANPFLK